MSDRLTSTPADETAPAAANPKMSAAKAKAQVAKDVALRFVRKHPTATALVAGLALTIGYYSGPHVSSSGVPVAQANLSAPASKTVSSGKSIEVEIVVGSWKKTDGLLILNNHKDYKQATMTIVVDLKAAPELAGVDPRSLKGLTVKAKGESQTYAGKPQIMVRRAGDLTVDPAVKK